MLRKVGMALLRGVLAVQVWVYRRSKGRLAGSMGGTPVLLLTTTGRRSGASRTRPVGFLPDGERALSNAQLVAEALDQYGCAQRSS